MPRGAAKRALPAAASPQAPSRARQARQSAQAARSAGNDGQRGPERLCSAFATPPIVLSFSIFPAIDSLRRFVWLQDEGGKAAARWAHSRARQLPRGPADKPPAHAPHAPFCSQAPRPAARAEAARAVHSKDTRGPWRRARYVLSPCARTTWTARQPLRLRGACRLSPLSAARTSSSHISRQSRRCNRPRVQGLHYGAGAQDRRPGSAERRQDTRPAADVQRHRRQPGVCQRGPRDYSRRARGWQRYAVPVAQRIGRAWTAAAVMARSRSARMALQIRCKCQVSAAGTVEGEAIRMSVLHG